MWCKYHAMIFVYMLSAFFFEWREKQQAHAPIIIPHH